MTWAVPYPLVAAFGAGSLLVGWAALAADGPGRLLLGLLAGALGAETLRSLLLRPTVRADDTGVVVVTGPRRRRFAWTEVEAVRPLTPAGSGRRLRRNADALEIDLGDALILVPRYRLGAPVPEVVAALDTLSSAGGGGGGG